MPGLAARPFPFSASKPQSAQDIEDDGDTSEQRDERRDDGAVNLNLSTECLAARVLRLRSDRGNHLFCSTQHFGYPRVRFIPVNVGAFHLLLEQSQIPERALFVIVELLLFLIHGVVNLVQTVLQVANEGYVAICLEAERKDLTLKNA